MKKFMAILLACVITLTIPMGVLAEDNQVKVNILCNDNEISTQGIIVNKRTLVSVRTISKALNASVAWDKTSKKITLTKTLYYVDINSNVESTKTRTVEMWIGKDKALLDGKSFSLNASPQLINGKTMLPARDVSRCLDATIDWFSNAVTIVMGYHESFDKIRNVNSFITDVVKGISADGWINIKELEPDYKNITFINNPDIAPIGFYYYKNGNIGDCFYEVPDFDGDYGKTTLQKSTAEDSKYDFNDVYDGIRMRGTNTSLEVYVQDLANIIARG